MSLNLGLGLALTRNKGVVVGPYPAPAGYRWEYLSDPDGTVLADNDGQAFVDLFKAA